MAYPTHILVIRLSAMGDVAMTVPVIKALVKQYPGVKITLLSQGFLAPLFNDIPQLHFYPAQLKDKHKGITGLYQLAQEIKSMDVDAIADLHGVLRTQILRKFLCLSRIPTAVINKGRSEKKALVNASTPPVKALKSSQQRYVDVFKKLNFSFDINQPVDRVKLPLNEHTKAVVGLDHLSWVGIAPFAQHQAKMYPADLMRELISALGAHPQLKVLLFGGGEKEKNLLTQLAKEIPGKVISIVGALSFSEELALISRLDLMVSMDSANGHLAANYGVPVITLWGGTHPYAGFSPLHQQTENQFIPDLTKFPKLPTSIYGNKQIEGYEEVMRSIEPTKIIQRIQTILEL